MAKYNSDTKVSELSILHLVIIVAVVVLFIRIFM